MVTGICYTTVLSVSENGEFKGFFHQNQLVTIKKTNGDELNGRIVRFLAWESTLELVNWQKVHFTIELDDIECIM